MNIKLRDDSIFYYTMKPNEPLHEAVISASLQASNNGFNAYKILDSNGKELPE